ncbi:MAG: N-acetyltransferase family protein [Chloroflexi bacterium]|nr:N-acetyltransferase family protein [Chloroflexota bacterium]
MTADIVVIDEMKLEEARAVLEIYALGIASGQATFETVVPDWAQWDANHLKMCRLVARLPALIVGWAALSAASKRIVYAGVAEVSIYVHPSYQRQGIGRKLLEELIRRSEDAGFWTLQSSMFPENTASVALHQKCGFRVVGRREKIARLNDTWRDTLWMERRSNLY